MRFLLYTIDLSHQRRGAGEYIGHGRFCVKEI
jgi:hypothetical protein